MLDICTVPCRVGYMDNLSYILVDRDTGISAVVDPSETAPIIAKCTEMNLKPDYIFNTHHHFDHTDGNLELKKLYGSRIVACQADAERIPGFDLGIVPGKTFSLGNSVADIIDVSAHTQNHILWYFKADKALFTGDTLFNLCIGGLFEGSVEQMFDALSKIKALPDDVLFYPGHEYTLQAVPMAEHFVRDDAALKQYVQNARAKIARGLPVSPVPLGLEKKCNPYLLPDSPEQFARLF